jgi:6-phosphogluconate dehydrogenase
MEIGFVGLGRMGGNMVTRLMERGNHRVVAYARTPESVAKAVEQGAAGAGSLKELIDSLQTPRVIWVMVPSGAPTEDILQALAVQSSPGDLIIDGGNSYFKDSVRRARELKDRGFEMLDIGTSGGIWGRELGYCMMVGGEEDSFRRVEPVLRDLAPANGYALVGPNGAGHFSKMIHNGIEYGMMQAYAEGFELLERSPFRYDYSALSDLWNQGSVVRSWLLELAAEAFRQDPDLREVAPYVEDTGEGRWTVQTAIEESVPAPVITQALFARFRSREENSFSDRVLAVLRKQFGGHAVRSGDAGAPRE